ncbi:NBR1-Ig-like domain-containing protein [Actinomadura gamaensis]|uniref:NBR1-Ig-like domain-containing protein n=1 Tax=Actinomadura gamaensis TaxID=1763541 RepID=A0ABV9TWQ9_9ACTN
MDDTRARAEAIADFASTLRELRKSVGNPSFREMSGRSGAISHTTLYEATKGNRLPSWGTTAEFVKACGADPADYRERWERANLVVRSAAAASQPLATPAASQPLAAPVSQPLATPASQPLAAPTPASDGPPGTPAPSAPQAPASASPSTADAPDVAERQSVPVGIGSQAQQPVGETSASVPLPPSPPPSDAASAPTRMPGVPGVPGVPTPPPYPSSDPLLPQPQDESMVTMPPSARHPGGSATNGTMSNGHAGVGLAGTGTTGAGLAGAGTGGVGTGSVGLGGVGIEGVGVQAALPATERRGRFRRHRTAIAIGLATAAVGAAVLCVVLVNGDSGPDRDAHDLNPSGSASEAAGTPVSCPVVPAHPSLAPPLHKGDAAAFIADMTLPDCTHVGPGQTVPKVWRIKNAGTVPWSGYTLRRLDVPQRPDECQTRTRVPIKDTGPGQMVDIRVDVTTPKTPGLCYVRFKMMDAEGKVAFPGNRPVNFQIIVDAP